VKVLAVLTALALVLFVLAAGGVWYAVQSGRQGEVGNGTFLHVKLDAGLSDAPQAPGLFDDPAKASPTLNELTESIHRAATDPRITGLYLEFDGPSGGWATWQELREAVAAFQATGKPCVAYAGSVLDNGTYYVASACKTVAMAPAAVLVVTGLSIEVTYYKDMLTWLGVEAEFQHVGDFKSAIEPFERAGPSAPAAEAYELLLEGLWQQMLTGIAAGRGVTVDQARTFVEQPTLTPAVARERGMIDALAWPDAMRARVHLVGAQDWAEQLAAPVSETDMKKVTTHLTPVREYVKDVRAAREGSGPKVALLYAEGSIVSGEGGGGLFGDDGNLTDHEYVRWMRKVRADDRVKAVVVRVNSPGGSALASSIMWRENAATRAAGKPVVVSMGDYAASGGYLISANADWIVAEPGTLTGSIGVFGGKFDISGAFGKLGITTHQFQRGPMSDLFSLTHGFDDSERAVFQEYLEDFYGQFLDIVSTGRKLDRDAVHAVAQGRVWTGEQALERGLVDQLGTVRDAAAKAAQLAGLAEHELLVVPARQTFFEQILEQMEPSDDVSALLPEVRALPPRVRADLATIEALSREGGAAAWLPGAPTVR
jgi:protease-4